MQTYLDVYKAVERGKIVTITNHFGNTRTYFKNESGFICSQFNKCAPHIVRDLEDNSEIESGTTIQITTYENKS
jgi:hypothetical protein